MMKKFFICLCLILSLCACAQSSVETDTEDDSEIVQVEDNTEETQTDEETEEIEDETHNTETSPSQDTDNNKSDTTQSSSSSSSTQTTNDNNKSTTDKSTTSSSNESSSKNTNNKTSSDNSSTTSSSSSNEDSTTTSEQSSETIEETKIYCTYTIECSSILNQPDALESNYQVPTNGIIYSQTVEIEEGDTVMSILKRAGVSTDISLGYVKGIDGLYEFDCGSESGWTYSVNGIKPNVGASKYSVSEGDVVQWIYVVSRSEW